MSNHRECVSEHDEYRAFLVRRGLRPDTITAYIEAVQRLEEHAGKPIQQVTPDDAAAFINRPCLSRSSRNTYHRWLSAWCRWSGSDLLAEVRRPAPNRPRPKPLDAGRVDLLLAACQDDEDTAIILLGSLVGLRRAEIARVQGSHLDRWESSISVHGKGDRDDTVPVPAALLRHARRMPEGYWFPSPMVPGAPVSPFTIGARVLAIAERAEVGHVTTHRLRHTYATELVRNGVPLTTVQRLMRHSQLTTTAVYIGVTGEEMAAAAQGLPWAA